MLNVSGKSAHILKGLKLLTRMAHKVDDGEKSMIISMNGYHVLKGIVDMIGLTGGILFLVSGISMLIYKLKGNHERAKKKAVQALIALGLYSFGFVGSIAIAVEQSKFDFDKLSTFQVYSNDIVDAKWNDEVINPVDGGYLSPELHWDAVSGASIYYVYMLDETADNCVCWQINGIPYTNIPKGLCDDEWRIVINDDGHEVKGRYLLPDQEEKTHNYTVYVFALRYDPFDVGAIQLDARGENIAQIAKELNHSPYTDYNNVIGYGKVSACYTTH